MPKESANNFLTGWICKPAELVPEAQEYLRAESAEFTTYNLDLDYDYWGTGLQVLALE